MVGCNALRIKVLSIRSRDPSNTPKANILYSSSSRGIEKVMCERLVSPKEWQLKLDAIFAFGV